MQHSRACNPLYTIVQGGDPTVLYDTGTNRLLTVDLLTAEILPFWGTASPEEIHTQLGGRYNAQQINERLDLLVSVEKEHGWLARRRPTRFVPPWNSTDVRKRLSVGLDCLVLSVTTACNFRCSYCLYGGSYRGYHSHGSEMMSLETAKSALQFFASHSSDAQEIHLSFYGGEPLLNLPVIRWGIETFPSVASGRKFYFHLTTNGSLLNKEEIARLLISADVFLTVSLDGVQEFHDYRRRTAGGDETFAIVMKGVELINKLDPEYFQRNVTFNAVLDTADDLPAVRNFFLNHPLLSTHGVMCSTVKQDSFVEESRTSPGIKALEDEFCDQVLKGVQTFDTFFTRLFVRHLQTIHNRSPFPGMLEEESFTGVCIPGRKELCVDIDGLFHICKNTCDDLVIGDIKQGFNFQEIGRIVDEYTALCTRLCSDCWAFRLCRLCYIHAFTGASIDEDKQKAYCQRERAQILEMLRRYYRVRRDNQKPPEFLSLGPNGDTAPDKDNC